MISAAAVEAAAAKCHVHGPGDVHMEEIPIVAGAFVGNGRQGVHSQKNQPVACVLFRVGVKMTIQVGER